MESNNNVIALKREGIKKGVYILPNLCTTASLFSGFYSTIQSLSGNFIQAAWAILVAGLFDFLDGRVARLTHAESEFGIEYDSLVDLASFGLAPAILIYTWGLEGMGRIGWLAAFLYFACGALRLARFNVQAKTVERAWFQGLPIPVAASVLSSMVIFFDFISFSVGTSSPLTVGVTILLSLLMVSTVPYRSFKNIHFKRRWSFFALVAIVGAIFVMALEPKVTIFLISTSYVMFGIIEELITLRKSKQILNKIKGRWPHSLEKELLDQNNKEGVL